VASLMPLEATSRYDVDLSENSTRRKTMKPIIAAPAFVAAIVAAILLERAGLVGETIANLSTYTLIALGIATGVYFFRRSKKN